MYVNVNVDESVYASRVPLYPSCSGLCLNSFPLCASGFGLCASAYHSSASPADALGYKFYIVPKDEDGNVLTPPSNTVNFAAG